MTLQTTSLESATRELQDVVVVGAGPAGAVAAREIARRGTSVLLVDRREFPRYKLCGACVSGASVAALHAIGLGEQLAQLSGTPLTQFQLHSGRRSLTLPIHGGVAVSRSRFDEMLVRAAIDAGARFLPNTELDAAAPTDDSFRILTPRHNRNGTPIRARVVVVASGLSSDRNTEDPALATQPASGSRFGAGTTTTQFPDEYANGTIFMAADADGYVGLTRIEDGSLNIAAALDHAAVRNSSPAAVCRSIVQNCGFPVGDRMFDGNWKGTVGLTRTTQNAGSPRLFVVGDAAGYVEPFTGEGMTWAISGGTAVAALAARAVEHWDESLTSSWSETLNSLVTRRQRWCRRLAGVLRYPKLVRGLMAVVSVMPSVGRALARRIHEAN